MAKKIFSTREAETFKRIEEQVKKINFLNTTVIQMRDESLLAPSLEREFGDNGYADLFTQIKNASSEATIGLLYHKIEEEKIVLKNIFKSLEGVKK